LEVAQQFRDEGNFTKALEYASRKDNAQFCGECLLALARQTLNSPSRDEDSLADAKR